VKRCGRFYVPPRPALKPFVLVHPGQVLNVPHSLDADMKLRAATCNNGPLALLLIEVIQKAR
jgi:hypothetical protein